MRRLALLLCLISAPAQAADLAGRAAYLDIVRREAAARGVPAALADAVAMVETGYRADAIGTSGEIGIMQVMPATARQLGFSGTLDDLFAPPTNIALGVEYLSRAWQASGGSICRALMKYRAGLAEEVMTPLSGQYCTRALGWLASSGDDLGASMPAAQPPADPYVIAMPGAAAAPQLVRPAIAAAAVPYRRSMADREAAVQARFDSHVRRPSVTEARVSAAISAATRESEE